MEVAERINEIETIPKAYLDKGKSILSFVKHYSEFEDWQAYLDTVKHYDGKPMGLDLASLEVNADQSVLKQMSQQISQNPSVGDALIKAAEPFIEGVLDDYFKLYGYSQPRNPLGDPQRVPLDLFQNGQWKHSIKCHEERIKGNGLDFIHVKVFRDIDLMGLARSDEPTKKKVGRSSQKKIALECFEALRNESAFNDIGLLKEAARLTQKQMMAVNGSKDETGMTLQTVENHIREAFKQFKQQ